MKKVVKNKKVIALIAMALMAVLLIASGVIASPPIVGNPPVQGKINYQGQLSDSQGSPLSGSYDMEFQFWTAPTGGSQVGSTITKSSVPVVNGIFSTKLDINQSDFTGQGLWLQMRVRPSGGSWDTWMTPRQEILPVPYALSLKPGAQVYSNSSTTALSASNGSGGYGLYAYSANNIALRAQNSFMVITPEPAGMIGVYAVGGGKGIYSWGGTTGVHGVGDSDGVRGESTNGTGIRGHSDNGDGIIGWTGASGKSGVYGHSQIGIGVSGRSDGDAGVVAVTTSTNSNHVALAARNEGSGTAIYAESGTDGYAAILEGNVQVRSASTGETVIELGEGLDYAEGFDVSHKTEIAPGTVLIIDPDNPGKLAISSESYDHKVAGIVTGASGLGSGVRLGPDQFDYDVALAGRVYCNVDATYGEVSPGDLLTTSPTPGYAMVVKDYAKAQGAILGKAMEEMPEGEKGQILVLVTLQ